MKTLLLAFQTAQGFVPVSPADAVEQLPAAPLLITAYSFVWVALFVYVWSIWNRLGKIQKEIQTLSQRRSAR